MQNCRKDYSNSLIFTKNKSAQIKKKIRKIINTKVSLKFKKNNNLKFILNFKPKAIRVLKTNSNGQR